MSNGSCIRRFYSSHERNQYCERRGDLVQRPSTSFWEHCPFNFLCLILQKLSLWRFPSIATSRTRTPSGAIAICQSSRTCNWSASLKFRAGPRPVTSDSPFSFDNHVACVQFFFARSGANFIWKPKLGHDDDTIFGQYSGKIKLCANFSMELFQRFF